jgi:hypothetical protein
MGNVGTGIVHLHYEQLYAPGRKDADTSDMVRPLLQGRGPIKMDPKKPISMTSTNGCKGGKTPPQSTTPTPTPGSAPTQPTPAPSPAPAPTPSPSPTTGKKFYVTTFADAPGRATPGGTQTGTLNKGRNYVFGKVVGPVVRSGSDHNKYWLKTDLDSGPAGQWVSAFYLQKWGNDVAKDDAGATIPTCCAAAARVGPGRPPPPELSPSASRGRSPAARAAGSRPGRR